MKYYILKRGKPKGSFTIEELREQNIMPTTLVRPDIQDVDGEEQPYKSADKFEELFELFIEPTAPITPPEIKEEKKFKKSKPIPKAPAEAIEEILLTSEITNETTGKVTEPFFQKTKELWAWTIGGLLVILIVGYLINPPLHSVVSPTQKNTTTDTSGSIPNNTNSNPVIPSDNNLESKIINLIQTGVSNIDNDKDTTSLHAFNQLYSFLNKNNYKLIKRNREVLNNFKSNTKEKIKDFKKLKEIDPNSIILEGQIKNLQDINDVIDKILNSYK